MPALTRLQLQNRVADLIGDPNLTQFTSTQVQDKLNEGAEHFAVDTQSFIEHLSLTLSSSRYLTLPSSAIHVNLIYDNTNQVILTRTSYDRVIKESGTTWQNDSSNYPLQFWLEIFPSSKRIGLYPLPNAYSIAYIADIVTSPATMSADSDYPFTDSLGNVNTLFNPYIMSVAYWSAAELLSIRPDQTNLIMVSTWMKKYEAMVANCIDFMKSLQYSEPSRMRGGRYYKDL